VHACWGRGLAIIAHHYCGPLVMVPLEEEVLQGPTVAVPSEEEEVPTPPPTAVPSEGRGCLIVTVDDKGTDDEGLVLPLVSSSPFFFSSKTQEIDLSLLSHKRGRFVG
jgi:hypothetical protein